MTSNYYTMGYDVQTGEKIKANCVESVEIVERGDI